MSTADYCVQPLSEETKGTEEIDLHLQDKRIKLYHCRFCAQEKKYDELLDLNVETDALLLFLQILEFFKIDFIIFSDQKLPRTICKSCFKKIDECYNFFVKAQSCQTILNDIYCVKEEKYAANLIEIITNDPINQSSDKSDKNNTIFLETEETKMESSINLYNSDKSQSPYEQECEYQSSTTIKVENLDDLCIPYNHNTSLPNTSYNSTEKDEVCNNFMIPCVPQNNNDNHTKSDSLSLDKFLIKSNSTSTIIKSEIIEDAQSTNVRNHYISWIMYPWFCKHCHGEFASIILLRSHSLEMHKSCFPFKCADCSENDDFDMFTTFIEHVRQHRNELRYYCPHCNEPFASINNCSDHTLTHLTDDNWMCEWCGEIFPNTDELRQHKALTKQPTKKHRTKLHRTKTRVVKLAKSKGISVTKLKAGTWNNYEWSCQDCSECFPNAQSLRAHSQLLHNKCFSMRCADCPRMTKNFRYFVRHVVTHRPYLKKYCPYCNEHIVNTNQLEKHVEDHFTSAQRPCDGCGLIFENKHLETLHYTQFKPIRQSKYLTPEDLTCDICKSVYKSVGTLKAHKIKHDVNRKKEVCHTCGKEFLDKSALSAHIPIHGIKNYICKVCNLSFVSQRYLRQHVKTHLGKQRYFCDYCSKGFFQKCNLVYHIGLNHTNTNKKFQCQICCKKFNTASGLKVHFNLHSGLRPYQCKNCDKTFTNWGNCNKHMMRIHKTTLAKTKLTAQGRIPIENIEKVKNMSPDTKEWLHEIIEPKMRAKIKHEPGLTCVP